MKDSGEKAHNKSQSEIYIGMDNDNGYDKYKYERYTIYGTISAPSEEHFVEDMRSEGAPREKTTPKKETYRGKRTRKHAFILCLVLLCFSLTVVAADVISGHSTLADYVAVFHREEAKGTTYYLVYASHSADVGISYKNASVIRAEGGAGYVMKRGDEHYVVVNAYAAEADAEAVVKKNPAFSYFALSLREMGAKDAATLPYAKNGDALCKKSYEALYEAANRLSADEYDVTTVKREFTRLRDEITAHEESVSADVSGSEDGAAIEYKVQLKAMKSAFENLLSHDAELASEARYYAVMILHSYSLFSEKYYAKP